MTTTAPEKQGLNGAAYLDHNYADQLVLVLAFDESWQSLVRQNGVDATAILTRSCKLLPFSSGLAYIDITSLAVLIDPKSLQDQEDLLPSEEEVKRLAYTLLLILAELSDAPWSFWLPDDWQAT